MKATEDKIKQYKEIIKCYKSLIKIIEIEIKDLEKPTFPSGGIISQKDEVILSRSTIDELRKIVKELKPKKP